jgi:Uma2 family endonuclease
MATAIATQLPLVLDLARMERVVLRPYSKLGEGEFFDFCQQHQLFRIERNSDGEIIIMAPAGDESGLVEAQVIRVLGNWASTSGKGVVLSSNAGITLPDGSTLCPDTCWIPIDRWKAVPPKQRKKFALLVPAFVIEVRSPSDRKKDLHEKMLTYLRNGVELGWVIDPESRTVRIYKPGEEPIELQNPDRVQGEGPVAGVVLDLKSIYEQLED